MTDVGVFDMARDRLPGGDRPSPVLGGRGMAIVYDDGTPKHQAGGDISRSHPVLIDRYLSRAVGVDMASPT